MPYTYAAGTGAYANPYQIANLADLNGIRDYPGAHFIVTADIDASPTATWDSGAGWSPIAEFTGTLRGQGRVVNGLHINRPSTDYVGLFAMINKTVATYQTAVRDLHLINANIMGRHYVGALCGQLTTTLYGDPNPRLLYNCSAEGSVSGVNYTGGLVGYAKGPTNAGHAPDPDIWYYSVNDDLIGMMEACVTDIVLTATGQASGGLIGFVDELNIYKCYTNGPVNGFALVGGLIGDTNRAYIEHCFTTDTVTGQIVTGGIVGRARFLSNIRNSYSLGDVIGISTNPRTGEVQSSQDATGGIAGELRGGNGGNFARCYSFGNVSGGYRVGGLIGAVYQWTASLTYVNQGYARGDVTGIDYVGGLIGYADQLQWYESYYTGAVTGQGANVGAILGGIGPSGKGEIKIWVPVYYNSDINRASSVNGGTGKSTSQLKNRDQFEWPQFDRSWVLDPADYENDGYPQLKIFYDPLGISLAAIRGGKSDTQDQGLVLGFTLNGKVYQRALKSGAWGPQQEVIGLQIPVKTLNLFRTSDHRLGYITDKEGRLSLAVTGPYGTAIQYTKELTDGTNGSLIERDDKLELYYITPALTIGKITADFSGDWSDITFGVQEPLTSDSYITKLKGKLFDSLYLVWQASGQHRLLKAREIAEKAEPLSLVDGSITIRDDSPVISANFEFDSFERPMDGGGSGVLPYPVLQWARDFKLNITGFTPVTHQTTVPDGYIGIYTAGDLYNVRNNMAANYIQMADIDLSGYPSWNPLIGAPQGELEGIYDGNGYSISNLKGGNPLFDGIHGARTTGITGKVKNVKLINSTGPICGNNFGEIDNCYVSGSSTSGGVVGYNYTGGTVKNITSDSEITSYGNGGGIASANYGGEISNAVAKGNVTGKNAGGICGYNDGKMGNCYAAGHIIGAEYTGGLCGQCYTDVPTVNCYATGNVLCMGDSPIASGGLIGHAGRKSSDDTECGFENCYATGSVGSDGQYVGGLFGYMYGVWAEKCFAVGAVNGGIISNTGGFAGFISDVKSINECFATGDISGKTAGGFAGVFWGYNDEKARDCYATGNVTGTEYAGGFIGQGSLILENCFSVGFVSGNGEIGGLIGWPWFSYDGGIVKSCYYDKDKSGQNDTGNGTPKSTTDMGLQLTYTGWDFKNTWFFNGDESSPDHTPSSKIKISFSAGNSAPFELGEYYVDRTNYTVGDENVRVEARNVIGKYLKDQTFDERNKYMPQALKSLFEQVLTGAGITKFHVAENAQSVGIEFAPNDAILDGIDELLKFTPGWQIREESEGLVVVAPRIDPAFTQPSTYTFYRNRDIFSRSVTKDDGQTYGRVCVHDPDMQTRVYRPVSSNLGWLPPAQKTYYVQVPAGTTSVDAAKYATELASQLSNSGEVETFVGPFRPQLMPGDGAEIMDDDGPRKLGTITTVKHSFGKRGFITEFTVDSGGKIGRPRLGDFINEMAAKFSKIQSKRIY